MGVSAEISAAQPGGDDWESSGRFRETFCAVPVGREGEARELLGGQGWGAVRMTCFRPRGVSRRLWQFH